MHESKARQSYQTLEKAFSGAPVEKKSGLRSNEFRGILFEKCQIYAAHGLPFILISALFFSKKSRVADSELTKKPLLFYLGLPFKYKDTKKSPFFLGLITAFCLNVKSKTEHKQFPK